jgi:nucleoside-diphosphate-sugar epimerase
MNLLVSGATGFVSRSILYCLERNPNLINKLGLVSLSQDKNLFSKNLSIDKEFIRLEDFFSNKLQNTYDVYIHGMSDPRGSNNRYETNFINLKKSLNVCLLQNIKTYVYLSSGAVYKKKGSKFDENDLTIALNRTANTYADAKLREEIEVKEFCRKNKINYIILRLFSFSGHLMMNRNEFAIIDLFDSAFKKCKLVVRNPAIVRSYMHQYDLGRVLVSISSSKNALNECINIGSPDAISMGELGLKISKITSATLFLEQGALSDFYVPSINKQKKFYQPELKKIDFIIDDLYSKFSSIGFY